MNKAGKLNQISIAALAAASLSTSGSEPPDQPSFRSSPQAQQAPAKPATMSIELPARRVDAAGDPNYVEPLFSKEYGMLLLQDTRHVLTAPYYWDKKNWLWFGAASAGLAAMSLLDKEFASFVERNHNKVTDAVSRNIDPFGQEYSAGVLAGFYVGGALFDNPKARAVAQDGLAASLIASGIITPALKITFGRARHEQGKGAYDFDFFNPHYTSFPSGHTTQAFAVASVIAAHYDSPWVKGAAYGTASLVGYARIQQNRHWPTDVAAGAIIGTVVGNSVVRFNQSKRAQHPESRVSFAPLFDGEAVGITIAYRF